MRLPRRVQVLLASFLALVVLALGLDVTVLRVRQRVDDRLQHLLEPARVEVSNVLTALVDQETSARGFLLTGEEEFLEPYIAGRVATEAALDELRELLRDRDDLLAGVSRLRSRVQAWQELGADFEIATKREGRDDVVRALISTGTGTALFEAARAEVVNLRGAIVTEIGDDIGQVSRLDQLLLLIDLGTLALAFVLLGIAGLLARQWFTGPLEALAGSVQAVAGGALQSTVTAHGPPDFQELAADIDAMRRRILAEVEEAERAREALAERGMVVVTLRDELQAGTPDLPPGVGLAGRFSPALGIVAGDWFDVVRLSDDRVALALVDVSGHGAGVGAFALRTKALTLAALQGHEPGDAFEWVASRIGDTGEQFLTGIIAVLDAQTGVVRYASAGHPPLLLGTLTGIEQLGPTGPLLGPLGVGWATEEVQLTRGGVLVAFSDGLLEARDADGVPFGIERIMEIVERTQLEGPDAVADACLRAVQEHQAIREDDLTLCVLSR